MIMSYYNSRTAFPYRVPENLTRMHDRLRNRTDGYNGVSYEIIFIIKDENAELLAFKAGHDGQEQLPHGGGIINIPCIPRLGDHPPPHFKSRMCANGLGQADAVVLRDLPYAGSSQAGEPFVFFEQAEGKGYYILI